MSVTATLALTLTQERARVLATEADSAAEALQMEQDQLRAEADELLQKREASPQATWKAARAM